ncbi:carbohydrate ABC transporter permease [Alicyclobacillus herbarius]|jgi:cellobiose transport system permease protein|uniref:carbohydrate ABC transporter permease n=1 Tax=Alicyclobacillus herbarius TaxID=122960 RepID=UPI0003F6E46F|nr:carbohydrate ABC transporter permease [Alicyclobacillus herbarius]
MRRGIDSKGISITKIALYLCLIVWFIFSVFPFYWLFAMSTRNTSSIFSYPPKLTFGGLFATNLHHLLAAVSFFHSMWNSLYVSGLSTLLTLFFTSLAGFSFAKFDFPGKKPLFLILLGTMMIPGQLSLVPMFSIMKTLHWVDNLKALIVPGLASAFGIFWIKQFAESAIHDDLLNAARIDGCGNFRLYYNVALPVLRPTLVALGIFLFMGAWNDYLWPLVVLNSPQKFTVQVMLSSLNGIYFKDYGMIMAGTLLATLPLLILFAIFSRKIMGSVAVGAIKS